MVSSKRCAFCKEVKLREAFYRGPCKDGLRSYCKTCMSEKSKESREKNPRTAEQRERRKAYLYHYARTPERRRRNAEYKRGLSVEHHMLRAAKERAKKKGLEFDLKTEDIEVPETCPLLGIPIFRGRGKKGANPTSPTLDRINPLGGYTRDNVWVISWRANRIKQDAALEELQLLVGNLEKYHGA